MDVKEVRIFSGGTVSQFKQRSKADMALKSVGIFLAVAMVNVL